MPKNFVFILIAFVTMNTSWASPTTTVDFIKVDQFGYKANLQKIAVISDPQTGFNSALAFAPSTAANQYQIRRWSDDAVMYRAPLPHGMQELRMYNQEIKFGILIFLPSLH